MRYVYYALAIIAALLVMATVPFGLFMWLGGSI
jgi:hypothetical protein